MIKFSEDGHCDYKDPMFVELDDMIFKNIKKMAEGLSPVERRALGFCINQSVDMAILIDLV